MPLFELPMQLDDHNEGNRENVISFLTGEEARGSQEHQPLQKHTGTPPSTAYPQQRKDTFSMEDYLGLFGLI